MMGPGVIVGEVAVVAVMVDAGAGVEGEGIRGVVPGGGSVVEGGEAK